MADKPPDAFLSYTRFDDQHDGGAITDFRRRLANAVRAVSGVPFEIFQDVDGIGLGQHWPGKLDQLLDEARFFVPILTPSYFTSRACRTELERFLRAEAGRGRRDLVLPIYYIECEVLEESELRASDPLARTIHERQHQDWRDLRFEPFDGSGPRRALEQLARSIVKAVRRAPQPSTRPLSTSAPAAHSLRVGTVFRDIDELWCPEMVELPGGQFMMGSSDTATEALDIEKPRHCVRIAHHVAIGRYPVTFEEYDHFCRSTRREAPEDRGWGRERRPVINVSWDDAKAYTDWLAGQSGVPYRLLSEAEWEYACRAETQTRYWWGDQIAPQNANYEGRVGRTSEVGAYPANPWGLYDMHGNVWERVEDRWHDDYRGAPADGSPWLQGMDAGRVARGGAWYVGPWDLRAACRGRYAPIDRFDDLGFRVARTLTP